MLGHAGAPTVAAIRCHVLKRDAELLFLHFRQRLSSRLEPRGRNLGSSRTYFMHIGCYQNHKKPLISPSGRDDQALVDVLFVRSREISL